MLVWRRSGNLVMKATLSKHELSRPTDVGMPLHSAVSRAIGQWSRHLRSFFHPLVTFETVRVRSACKGYIAEKGRLEQTVSQRRLIHTRRKFSNGK
jgi:hypothetical protein